MIVEQSTNQMSPYFGGENAVSDYSFLFGKVSPTLGSREDIEETSVRPLLRALYCLQHALQLLHLTKSEGGIDSELSDDRQKDETLESIFVNTAYVYLELRDPYACLKASQSLLLRPIPGNGDNVGSDSDPDETAWQRRVRWSSLRRRAVVKMYACESLCLLGKPTQALEMLRGSPSDGEPKSSNVALDTVAKELVGLGPSEGSDDTTLGAVIATSVSCSAVYSYLDNFRVAEKARIQCICCCCCRAQSFGR